jgi:hypothetical protein
MTKTRWHTLRDDHAVTVARHLPVRFDLRVGARIDVAGPVSLACVAHQIRQDVWRALRRLRGFSPVVRVGQTDDALSVEAGGRCDGPVTGVSDRIAAVLDHPANRQRWLAHAGRRA